MSRSLFVLTIVCVPGFVSASEPTVDSIDYGSPNSYLEVPSSLGDVDRISKHAASLKGRSDRATVRKVLQWMDANLTCDPKKAYRWRNYDVVVNEGCFGSCADQAVVCGVLLRAAGIPTIWVKTMDVQWIWDLKKGRPFESWSGHVFLEVNLGGEWMLLDPGAELIYGDYSPKSRILPGNRFAYHKGNDPKQMIMSLQWEDWKRQTQDYFERLDASMLPVNPASGISIVPQVYFVANSPYYQALTEIARSRGWSARQSFNCEYENNLPRAKGHVLLIETHKGVPIVPLDVLHQFYPDASRGLKQSDGVTEINGTTIVFVDFSKVLDVLDDGGAPSIPKSQNKADEPEPEQAS